MEIGTVTTTVSADHDFRGGLRYVGYSADLYQTRIAKVFVELESLTTERDELNIEWGQLQIEQSTWATHARIERVAAEQLSLVRPEATEIYVIERQ